MRRALLLALLLVCGAAVRGQERPAVVLSGESRAAAGRIEEVRQRLDAKKWEAAVAEVQNVVETSGDELAPVGPGRVVQARLACQRLLIALPPEARPEVLRLYRARVEGAARKRLEQGLAERDVAILRKVVDEAFCTRAAERALDALGDLAFERGRFDEAEHWWRTLTPLAPGTDARDLFFPDPETAAARTRAKQMLARLFRGDARWDDDLAAYRKLHADAAGKLAGREGRYADVLKSVADALRPPDAPAGRDWSTFGGDPARGALLPATGRQTDQLGALCRRPAWRFGLGSHTRLDDPPLPPEFDGTDRSSARSLAFHPLLVGDRLLVADARTLTAIDLRSGRGEKWYDAGLPAVVSVPAAPDLRYTLTAADDCVLARFGATELRDEKGEEDVSLLACLELEPGRPGRRLRWAVRAAAHNAGLFEGAAVAQDGLSFIAATRCANDRTVTAVHCYALEARGTPAPRWVRDVCETGELGSGRGRRRHHLLTLAGPNVVYCSHSGAIIALDALTGRRTWAVRYPVAAPPAGPEIPGIDRPPLRDLTPCLYAAGRLFVAPSDSDRLLCLDPATGRTLWERKIADVVHLLGVGRSRLVFTTSAGLRAVDAADGADVWTAPDAGELPPMGRGLLLGDLVLWPTTRGVLLIRQEDGRLAEDAGFLRSVPKGNLAFAHGRLAVADRTTVTLFAPPAQQLEERRRDAEREPESAEAALELGIAEADAGQFDEAVKTLETAERLARSEPERRARARAVRHAALLTAARRAEDGGRRDESERALGQAAGAEYTAAQRVAAQRALAEQRERVSDHVGAVAAWQALLEDAELRGTRVTGAAGLPQTAGQLAEDHIKALVKKNSPAVYDAVEKRARARFDAAPKGKERAAALERLTEEFPNAAVRRVALRELLKLYSDPDRAASTVHACQRLRANPGPEDDEDKLFRILAGSLDNLTPGPPVPPTRLPLFRSWQVALDPGEEAASDMGYVGRYFVFTALPRAELPSGGWLRCRSEADGKLFWQAPVPFVPEWIASSLHLILLGGPHGVAAVRLDDGHLVWTFPARASHFQTASGHVLFLEEGRLLAVSLRSGRVVWQREAPGAGFLPTLGRFRPGYHADNDRVLIQTATGRRWLLDAETGRTLDDVPSPEPWPTAPRLFSEHRILLVEDARRLVALDDKTGREVWTTTVNAPSMISGDPSRVCARRWEKAVLVLTQTNLGPRLQRLDADTGKPLWATMPLLDPGTNDPADWGLDEKTVYMTQGGKLSALSLADGKPHWETTLPGSAASWRASREGDFLLVYPARTTEWRFQFRSPFLAVQWGVSLPPEERPGAGCPLLAVDPATGRVEQRWNLPAGPMRLRAYPGEAAMWPGLEVVRGSGDAGLKVLHTHGWFRSDFVFVLGGRAWGMTTRE